MPALQSEKPAAAANTNSGEKSNASAKKKTIPTVSGGRPDRAAFDREQDIIAAKIEKLQLSNNEVRAKIAALSGNGPDTEKKAQLRTEMDAVRNEQAEHKGSRQKIINQLKTLQDSRQRKIQELQASRNKTPFKSLQELDAHIRSVEEQVNSGTMKIVDEKKALGEISQLKKSRKTVESLSELQKSIDEDKAKIDSIRSTLDGQGQGESKVANEKYNKLRRELDVINKSREAIQQDREKLIAERNEINKQIDDLWTQKKENYSEWRAANERFRQRIQDERQRRIDKEKAEKLAQEEAKREEEISRLREDASAPAFEREMGDCTNLIAYFEDLIGGGSGNNNNNTTSSSTTSTTTQDSKLVKPAGRQVDSSIPEGVVVMKKKNAEEENYFVASGGKKNKKGGKKSNNKNANNDNTNESSTSSSSTLHLPMHTMSALFALNVTPPTSRSDIPQCIKAIQERNQWFQENQESQTKKNIEDAEKKIEKLKADQEKAKAQAQAQAQQTKEEEVPAAAA